MLAVEFAVAQCTQETATAVARHHSLLVCMIETCRFTFNQNPLSLWSPGLAPKEGREDFDFKYR